MSSSCLCLGEPVSWMGRDRSFRFAWLAAAVLLVFGCGDDQAAGEGDTEDPETETPAVAVESAPHPTAAPAPVPGPVGEAAPPKSDRPISTAVDLLAVAQRVSQGVGVPTIHSDQTEAPGLIVFEETHTSIPCQIEIAIMLDRLHRDHGALKIALEGFVKGTTADAGWFHKDPFTAEERATVAAQLLANGEISDAECLALSYANVSLVPIEEERTYRVRLPQNAQAAPLIYLYRIGLRLLGADPKLKALKGDPNQVDYVLENEPWVAPRARTLRSQNAAVPTDRMFELIAEIEAKCEETGADPLPAEVALMTGLKDYLNARDSATTIMVDSAIDELRSRQSGPVLAMVIGVAHEQRAAQLLLDNKIPHVIIRPKSLYVATKSISMSGFERKNDLRSVDEVGLGPLIDGRRKPPPRLGESWFQGKTEAFVLSGRVARAVADDQGPTAKEAPFGLKEADLTADRVRVSLDTMRREGDEAVFQMTIRGEEQAKERRVWVRIGRNKNAPRKEAPADLEGKLLAERENALARFATPEGLPRSDPKRPPSRPDGDAKKSEPRPLPKGVEAVSPDVLLKTAVDGSSDIDRIAG